MKRAIIGYGGFAREVKSHLQDRHIPFFVDDKYWQPQIDVYKLSDFDPMIYEVLIAVGDPNSRKDIVNRLPKETKYFSYIHPRAAILDRETVKLGEGSIVCAGVILTTNIVIGKHAQLNLNSTIGHDCRIEDFFTSSPGVNVSGNCNIGDCVYIGTNSSIREKINICNNVTVGMQSGVIKNILTPGTYVGSPVKKI